MTRESVCPPEGLLQEFGLGRLEGRSSETIGLHLETCVECRQFVANLSGDDFLDRLRRAQAPAPEAIESLAQSRSETPAGAGSRRAPDARSVPPELANHPDYELLKELGRGGMGVVYLARNRMMDRLEVLKVVSKKLLDVPGALERFQQEIRSAAKLNHPNIVGAYSVLRPGDLLVFAMEYVEGHDLAQTVKKRGPLPVTNATFYAHQAALGLQHAFEKGMVHRDIKPNNLMLALEGKKHVVKILDFGLAKATSEKRVDGALTKSGQMLGTPDYIAPEQTLDAPGADIRADLYSLGCTLYFLLAGKPPFTGNSLYEILHAHHAVTATPLDQLRPEIPAALAQVVARMMAKQPADRYQTPLDAAKALGPFFKAGAAPQPLPAEQPAVVPQAAPTAMPLMPFAPRLETAPSPFATFEGAAPAPLLNSATVTTSSSSAFPSYAPPSHVAPSYAPSPYTPSPYAPPSYVPPSYDAPTASPVRTKTERKPPRKRGPGLLIAAAAGGCLLCLGIWLVVRDKEGNETARVQVPDGGNLEIKAEPSPPSPTIAPAPSATDLVPSVPAALTTLPPRPSASAAISPRPAATAATSSAIAVATISKPLVPTGPAPPPAIAPFDAAQARAHQEAWAKHLGTEVESGNSLGMTMVVIPPGEFLMGSTREQVDEALRMPSLLGRTTSTSSQTRFDNELPQHRVILTKPFSCSSTEVTIRQFRTFVEGTKYESEWIRQGGGIAKYDPKTKNSTRDPDLNWRAPGYSVTDDTAVSFVTWNDAAAFCNWLSVHEGLSPCYVEESGGLWRPIAEANGYRLPTEAEWEYTCRSGTSTQFHFGDDPRDLDDYGWHSMNAQMRAHEVGKKRPNAFGIYDMHGNVEEYCQDRYGRNYAAGTDTDPAGPPDGSLYALRGGSWYWISYLSRSALRSHSRSSHRFGNDDLKGFRVFRSLTPVISGPNSVASGSKTLPPGTGASSSIARSPAMASTLTVKGPANKYVAAEGLPKPHAHFLFNGSGGDEVSDESRTTLKNVEFRDGALFVNGRSRSDGSGLSSTARLVTRPVSSKTFTLAMRIRAEDFDPAHAVLVGAPDWQPPFKLGTADNGILSMNFGQARSRTFEGAELRPDEWTVVAYGVDLNVGRCTVFLNGKKVGDWDIAKRNATEVAGDDEPRTTWTFSNVFGNTSFHGLVDEFILYDRLLTSDEFAKIPLRADLTSPMVSRHPPEVLRDFAAEARTRVAGRPTGPARMVSRFLFNGNTSDELNPTNTSNQYMRGAKFEQDALHLDSKSGYGTLRAKPVGSRAFTVALRFKASDFSNSHAQLLTSNIGGGFSMYRNSDTGNLTVSLDNLAFFREVDGAHLEPARWTTLVCGIDMDLGKCVVRLNGRPAGSFDFPATLETSQLGWCTFSTYGHRGRFQGLIDELLLYDRLLTEEEFDQVPLDSGP